MTKMRSAVCWLALAASLVSTAPALATTITRTYTFAFEDFTPNNPGIAAPVDPLEGSFTVTFDPTVAVNDATAGLTVNSLDLPNVDHFAFSYTPLGELVLGAVIGPGDNSASVSWGTNDFVLGFLHPLDTPVGASAFYTVAGVNNVWSSQQGTVSARDGAPGVPEPSSWLLMVVGFGALGAGLRRREGQGRFQSSPSSS